ncbi:hypothetical protein R6Q59_024861 [Mikania micrantha]
MGREKKDMNPVILRIGLALAFSLGGMLCTFIRNNSIKPAKSSSEHSKSSDGNNQEISLRSSESEHHASLETANSCQFDPLSSDIHQNSLYDKDSYLLPEFNDLVKEFDSTTITTNLDVAISNANSPPKVNSLAKLDSQEQEINNLRNMVKMHKERERNLEVQLLKYYGLKEQEAAIMELQNRLKLNNMEAKLFALKIESLETDNKRLESQMLNYNKVLTDLEAARAKIKVLQKKLTSEAAQNKERILDLQQRVEKMQKDEDNLIVGIDPEIELKLCRLKDLEIEVNELRKSNSNLQVEKSELTQRLEQVQILATSVMEHQEVEKLKTESEHLKNQNEILSKEMEQLQADRCSDVEELVYMRWLNACLRYELRNHQPGPAKTMARDLSITLSPNSEQKAKRLILEYATQEGDGKTVINIPELGGSDQWSSPSSSNLMNSSELKEDLVDHRSSRKSSYKFLGKVVKFLRRNDPDHCSQCRNSSLERVESVEEDVGSCSDYSFGYSSKRSMDSQMPIDRHSDFGRIDSIAEGGAIDYGSFSSSDSRKSELLKYAEVLQDSYRKPTTRYRWRSTPFSSF